MRNPNFWSKLSKSNAQIPKNRKNVRQKIVKLKFADSRHAQLSIYAVFDEESDVQVKNKKFQRPEAKK